MTISLDEMEQLVAQIADLREKEDKLSLEKKLVADELELKERLLIAILNDHNMTSYKSRYGTISVAHRSSVKTPKTEADRAAFFQYLREKGLFDNMITVNSQTLNAFYKKELDEAIESGNPNFDIPGLGEPNITQTIKFSRR